MGLSPFSLLFSHFLSVGLLPFPLSFLQFLPAFLLPSSFLLSHFLSVGLLLFPQFLPVFRPPFSFVFPHFLWVGFLPLPGSFQFSTFRFRPLSNSFGTRPTLRVTCRGLPPLKSIQIHLALGTGQRGQHDAQASNTLPRIFLTRHDDGKNTHASPNTLAIFIDPLDQSATSTQALSTPYLGGGYPPPPHPFGDPHSTHVTLKTSIKETTLRLVLHPFHQKSEAAVRKEDKMDTSDDDQCLICLQEEWGIPKTSCCQKRIHADCIVKCLDNGTRCPHCRQHVLDLILAKVHWKFRDFYRKMFTIYLNDGGHIQPGGKHQLYFLEGHN